MFRSFGQYCGLAKSLEMIGERWSLLVVRDLVLGPKRYTELRAGLPRIPSSLLSARLNELERAGVVQRRVLAHLDASVVYELTDYGRELEGVVLQLGLWGARALGDPAREDVFTPDSAVLALYATFRPDRARDVQVSFELRYSPQLVLHAMVDDGALKVAEGTLDDADLRVEIRGPVKPLFAADLTPAQALESGLLSIDGDPDLLDLFVDLFHIPAAPLPVGGIAVR